MAPTVQTCNPVLVCDPVLLCDRSDSVLASDPVQASDPVPPQNLSFVLEKGGAVKFEDRPVPEIKDPHDVIVNVRYTGICGSDVHYCTHGCIGNGHGAGCAVPPLRPLSRGKLQLVSGNGVRSHAAVRRHTGQVLPHAGDFCYKLPSNVSMQEGAMLEPTAVAVHFCRLAKVSPGQKVVVFGVGPVGLLTCKVARYVFGATTVVGVDVNEKRLAVAKEHGATHVYQGKSGVTPQESAEQIIAECGLGDGADVVIDASGAEPCIQTAIYVARSGGTFTQGGMGKTDIMFPIGIMCGKELLVTGSFRYSAGDYQLALDMVASGQLNVKGLISKIVPFEEAKEAFDNVQRGNGIKWLIEGPK
ncbi:sorbitol dehydrogenase, putative [Phytophthora infestans T30-4]|uniref:Sorbitol dehydrogenase, putative n=1 Tax=Phytophthora infestans (strain T30-4) TaxID=403677 RepID=D0N2I3_PHYIT|nr:sorbitol dehydrogenase, putative [Phytophthora infestans T30-4]EEY68512.1 sorbitol dehydrogenase, putative [Phytophthora infestans T30-4]|eukprot:XP_002905671.1 sorbitol dehydrogenase, putative [Phytophthora infestans T30-4]